LLAHGRTEAIKLRLNQAFVALVEPAVIMAHPGFALPDVTQRTQ
jgi:hypothetical protein